MKLILKLTCRSLCISDHPLNSLAIATLKMWNRQIVLIESCENRRCVPLWSRWFGLIADFDDVILAVCKRKIYKLKSTECGRVYHVEWEMGGSRKLIGVELNIFRFQMYSIDRYYRFRLDFIYNMMKMALDWRLNKILVTIVWHVTCIIVAYAFIFCIYVSISVIVTIEKMDWRII